MSKSVCIKDIGAIAFALSAISLSACTGGGRVDIHQGSQKVENLLPSPPMALREREQEAQSVAALFMMGDENARQELLRSRLEPAGLTFAWTGFWEELGRLHEQNKNLPGFHPLSADHARRLYSLQAQSCTVDSVKAAVAFLSRFGAAARLLSDSIHSPCAVNLGPAFVSEIVRSWISSGPSFEGAIAGLLDRETRQADPASWRAQLAEIDVTQWNRLLRKLIETGDLASTLRIIGVHRRIGSHVSLGEPLIGYLSNASTTEFDRVANELGSGWVINQLLTARRAPLAELPAASAEKLLAHLGRLPLVADTTTDPVARVHEAFYTLSDLRAAERRIPALARNPYAVDWLDQIHHRFELILGDVAKDNGAALARIALQAIPNDSIDANWFKLRFAAKLSESESQRTELLGAASAALELNAEKPLDVLIKSRIALTLASSRPAEAVRMIDAHCELMKTSFAISSREITEAGLRELLTSQTPISAGCLNVRSEHAISITLNDRDVRLPSDVVLRMQGQNLSISAQSFDAALIDLSADQSPRQAETEPTSSERDALVFPLMIGFKPAIAGGAIQWIAMHYVHREAGQGEASSRPARNGHNGGDLSIDVAETHASFMPTLVSKGAPGELGARPRAGGRSDSSTYSYENLRGWLAIHRATLARSGNDPEHLLLTQPTLKTVFDLLQASGAHSDATQALTSAEYIRYLPREQSEKIRSLCASFGPGTPAVDRCLREQILPQALFRLKAALVGHDLSYEFYEYAPFLPQILSGSTPTVFTSPGGTTGPQNADGADGSNGSARFQIQGVHP